MYRLVLFFIAASFFGCASPRNQKLVFFREASNRLTPKHELTYSAIFLIENYCTSKDCEVHIDSLIQEHYKTKTYKQYLIELFKESKKLNIKNLMNNPRDFEKYSDNEHVLTYRFLNGKFLSKDKYKNGESVEIIDTALIKIEPAHPLKH
ncbi:MAG: hypothetical protein EOO90_32250 [Pedobacter sp.]|nr:MAG: hypothetical protein EOO90_32250 [Pedobacter sp.]